MNHEIEPTEEDALDLRQEACEIARKYGKVKYAKEDKDFMRIVYRLSFLVFGDFYHTAKILLNVRKDLAAS